MLQRIYDQAVKRIKKSKALGKIRVPTGVCSSLQYADKTRKRRRKDFRFFEEDMCHMEYIKHTCLQIELTGGHHILNDIDI